MSDIDREVVRDEVAEDDDDGAMKASTSVASARAATTARGAMYTILFSTALSNHEGYWISLRPYRLVSAATTATAARAKMVFFVGLLDVGSKDASLEPST